MRLEIPMLGSLDVKYRAFDWTMIIQNILSHLKSHYAGSCVYISHMNKP
ncbi:MAG: hypothetical protein KAS67_01855 [Thermoplasmata archaeon]|nr:hypothetical protein [Thermoplasmata archaeon]